jgi:hypothetical protein
LRLGSSAGDSDEFQSRSADDIGAQLAKLPHNISIMQWK